MSIRIVETEDPPDVWSVYVSALEVAVLALVLLPVVSWLS